MSAQIAESADFLDGIILSMTDNRNSFNFDNMLSAMTNPAEISFISSVAESMEVNNTLDYLSNLYESRVPDLSAPSREFYKNRKISPNRSTSLPVKGAITSLFGYREAYNRMHKGIDIKLQIGDTVCTPLDGRVQRVDWDPKGYGLFIVINHNNGLETVYGHLSRALVYPGSQVLAGRPIALGGNTGNSTGPHLHFETRRHGEAFDPTIMFDFSVPGTLTRLRSLADLDNKNPKSNKTLNLAAEVPISNEEMYWGNKAYINSTEIQNETSNKDELVANYYAVMTAKNIKEKNTYIVRQGDTVESISQKTGVRVLTLCHLNMISSDERLKPGRMLRLK